MAGGYSAGTIFLQVVPVFGDLVNETRRQAEEVHKQLGGDLEKAGRDAGKRAGKAAGEEYSGRFADEYRKGMRSLQREVAPIKIRVESNETRSEFAKIKREIKELGDAKIGVDVSAEQAYRRLRDLHDQLDVIHERAGKIQVKTDIDSARKPLQNLLNTIEKANPQLTVDLDTRAATRAASGFEKRLRASAKRASDSMAGELNPRLAEIRAQLAGLGDLDITADLDTKQVREQIAELSRELKAVAKDQEVDFLVRADAQDAYLDMKAINSEAALLDGKSIDVTVELHEDSEKVMGAFEARVRSTAVKSAKALDGSMSPTVRRIRRQLEDIGDVDITPEVDAAQARTEIANLARELRALANDRTLNIDVRTDAATAYAGLLAFNQAANAVDGRDIDVSVDLDAAPALTGLAALRASLLGTGQTGEAAANSFRSFNFVVLAAATLLPALIPIIGALGGALLALLPILGSVGAGLGVAILGFSGIGDAVSGLAGVQDSAAKDQERSAKKIRSATDSVADAQRSLADARRNAARAAKDSARAEADAARQGARAVADAERAVADARRNAAQANEDAQRRVAEARRSAAASLQDALDRQRDAQDSYRDAVRGVQEAEQALTDARRRGYAEIDDTEDRLADNQLDERQGVIDVFNATVANDAAQSDGAATNLDREEASIALERAKRRLEEVRETEKELRAERRKQRREGVNGTQVVENAQDALSAALERQRDAQEAVGDAAKAVNDARIEGARRVAEAIEAQQRTEASSARSLADARRAQQQAEEDAARSIADARRRSSRSEQDGARNIAAAQRRLAQAQIGYRDAVVETAEVGSTSMQELEKAMGKLGPAGQRFARYLFSLRDGFYSLRRAVQEALLPPVQRAFETIIGRYGPGFERFAVRMGAAVGRLFEQSARQFAYNPVWEEFFATMSRIGPRLFSEFGQTTLNWFQVFANLMTIAAPFALRLSEAMLNLSKAAADFVASKEGTKFWNDFLEYAFKVGPVVADFFWALVRAFVNIGVALAPWGTFVLKMVDRLANWIADMDPRLLGAVAGAVIGLVIAFQLAVGSVSALYAGAAALAFPLSRIILFAGGAVAVLIALYVRFDSVREVVDALYEKALKPLVEFLSRFVDEMLIVASALIGIKVALVLVATATKIWAAAIYVLNKAMKGNLIGILILALIAVVTAVIYAYRRFEGFRRVVDTVFAAIRKAAIWLWEKGFKIALNFILKAWGWLVTGIKWAWRNVLQPVLDAIFLAIGFLWEKVVRPYLGFVWKYWKAVFGFMKAAWNNILYPILDLIGTVFWKLWDRYVKPVLEKIQDKWKLMMMGMKAAWRVFLKPVFDAIVDTALPKLKSAFQTAVRFIGKVWGSLKGLIGAPIRFVIEKIINEKLIGGFNKIADFVGSTPMKPIPTGPKYKSSNGFNPSGDIRGLARGGIAASGTYNIYPGYTPGRDTGYIGVGGGEAIMRPEWTRAIEQLSPGFVDSMNSLARQRGVGGVKQALKRRKYGDYAKGGVVWPVPGRTVSTYAGHDGVDINRGSGWDDFGDPIVSATRGVVSYVGSGRGYGSAIFVRLPSGQELVYGHTSAASVRVGQSLSPGSFLGRVGNTGNSSAPHLHFGFPGGTYSAALALLRGGVFPGGNFAGAANSGGAGFGLPDWLQKIFTGPASWVKDKISGGVDALKSAFGESPYISMLAKLPGKLVSGMVDKISSIVGAANPNANGDMGKFGSVPGGSVTSTVRQVAEAYGWGGGDQWTALAEIINRESGWNPLAANPTSSARGLFQKMTSIHGPLEKTVAGQAGWGLNYIKSRYGDPRSALTFHNANGWYSEGGIVGEQSSPGSITDNGTMMYDSGGYLPPGLTTVLNLTGKPEPVFTSLEEAAKVGTSGGITYAPTFNQVDLTAEDVADDLLFTLRRVSRGGKYGGSL